VNLLPVRRGELNRAEPDVKCDDSEEQPITFGEFIFFGIVNIFSNGNEMFTSYIT
jgi:hypothetical protein